MKKRLFSHLSGEGLRARAMRGSALTIISIGGARVLRLLSNLLLTRILFPEAFGLMALVQVFTGGLQMFSDIGIKTSIIQHDRGDEEDFLNTAWTLNILRGVLLWLGSCALALPAAWLYSEPLLAQILPVIGLNSIINGFATTNMSTANRHMRLGLQTMIQLGCQAIGIAIMVVLAYWIQAVWALVYGTLISSVIRVVVFHYALPGIRNKFRWDRSAVRELIGFGKFIFLSTIAGFAVNQSDRAILGAYITLSELGVYNIGMLFGMLPAGIALALSNKVIFPLYRLRPPIKSVENQANIFQARRLMISTMLVMTVVLSFGGIFMIELLYDPRYALAGPMVALFGLAVVPKVVFSGYDGALLAQGDSRRFFIYQATTAAVQVVYMIFGVAMFGIFGAILAPGLAILTTYPLRTYFLRHYKANDNLADAIFLAIGFSINGLACWLNWDAIRLLIG